MGSGASAAARRYEAPDKLAEATGAIDWEVLDATERTKVKEILRKVAADDASGWVRRSWDGARRQGWA